MGEAQGNYDEFRFFTGLRPSEEMALLVTDCDVERGKLRVIPTYRPIRWCNPSGPPRLL